MLTPNYLSNTTNGLVYIYDDIEFELTKDIVQRLQSLSIVDLTDDIDLSYSQLQQAETIVFGSRQEVEKEVYTSIGNAVVKNVEDEKKTYKEAYEKKLIPYYVVNNQAYNAIATNNAIATLEYMRELNVMLTSSSNAMYKELIEQAYVDVINGVHIENAIESTINTLTQKGIKIIEFDGTRRNIDTAVRNSLQTAINQTVSQINISMVEDMGANIVQTTAHYDARPSHADWQGRSFWIRYPESGLANFYDITGYGTGSGLGGWGCRHSFFAKFKGLSQDNYAKERKEYDDTLYKLEQEQRYNERKIREWKRRASTKEYAGYNNTLENNKVGYWQKRQRDLIDSNKDLYRDYQREHVN